LKDERKAAGGKECKNGTRKRYYAAHADAFSDYLVGKKHSLIDAQIQMGPEKLQ
jgi:hypothetical protein